jgi:hypothetical protein
MGCRRLPIGVELFAVDVWHISGILTDTSNEDLSPNSERRRDQYRPFAIGEYVQVGEAFGNMN